MRSLQVRRSCPRRGSALLCRSGSVRVTAAGGEQRRFGMLSTQRSASCHLPSAVLVVVSSHQPRRSPLPEAAWLCAACRPLPKAAVPHPSRRRPGFPGGMGTAEGAVGQASPSPGPLPAGPASPSARPAAPSRRGLSVPGGPGGRGTPSPCRAPLRLRCWLLREWPDEIRVAGLDVNDPALVSSF